MGLLTPPTPFFCLVLSIGWEEEGGWLKTKGFQVAGGRGLPCTDGEVHAGELGLRAQKPCFHMWLCHWLTTLDKPPFWASVSPPVKPWEWLRWPRAFKMVADISPWPCSCFR